jgi:hypothetical protein
MGRVKRVANEYFKENEIIKMGIRSRLFKDLTSGAFTRTYFYILFLLVSWL